MNGRLNLPARSEGQRSMRSREESDFVARSLDKLLILPLYGIGNEYDMFGFLNLMSSWWAFLFG